MRFAELDAVTVDGFGTLLRLTDPVPSLRAALAERGVERSAEEVESAFRVEAAHYRPHAHLARDAESLAAFRRECVGVFLAELGNPLEPGEFVDAFIGALAFEPVPGAPETLERLRGRGLRLAVVANWDCALPEHLAGLGLDRLVDTVVTSARAGVPKPDPAIFELALRELGVPADRALHVGDEPCDEEGARAAGLRFAPAPLSAAFEGWT
jgi:HAD superfamily hydrolase (TIGR01509 family)